MGFRSTITMQDYGQKWPAWLLEKYKRHDFPTSGPLSFKFECKIYDDEIFLDMRKALLENNYNFSSMRVIALHECGGVTAIDISKEGITYCEPTGWVAVNFITHSYCSDCSLPNHQDQRPGQPIDNDNLRT